MIKKTIILFFILIITINIYSLTKINSQQIYQLLDQVSLVRNMQQLKELSNTVIKCGKEYEVDPVLLVAIAKTESNFYKDIQGSGNCWGYFQINLDVHQVSDNFLNDTAEQTKMGAYVYSQFRKIFKNRHDSLNGYNGWVNKKNNYAQKVINSYNKYIKIIQKNRIKNKK